MIDLAAVHVTAIEWTEIRNDLNACLAVVAPFAGLNEAAMIIKRLAPICEAVDHRRRVATFRSRLFPGSPYA